MSSPFFSERYLLHSKIDLTPSACRAGRAFFIPWSIVGIGNMTLLFSVLSEGWSSHYKSNLQAGRVRRLVRQRMLFLKQAPKKSATSEKPDVLARLLDSEGYKSVAEEPVPPDELPKKVADTVRAFHAHARYFMLGRSGDPPPQLRTLLDAVDDLDTQLDPILTAESALAASTAGRDTKHYLFMLAYEREFDRVIASAGQLSSVIEGAEKKLLELKEENDLLQAELRQLRLPISAANDSPLAVKETGSPDSPRSPSAPRTPNLSFMTPRSTDSETCRRQNSLGISRTNTFPQPNTASPSSSLHPHSSLGVRGGVASR